jgi:microcystin-dependent protein
MSNADYTLSNLNGVLDEARNMVLVVQGTNSGIYQIIAPLNQPKFYIISNQTTGGYAITFGSSSGSTVNIPNGITAQVYTDGTNFYSAQTGSAGSFNVNGTLTANGIADVGALSVSGNLNGSTATFSGAISSVSPNFTGTPTAPTATAGTNTTQIATTAFVQANGGLSGQILMWPTASAPTGYLLCTGTAVSRTTYAALYAVIGTTFGVGDGSTTFNLPNYTNRMPYGTTIGATGGSADSIVVSHTHTATSTVTDPGHNHTIPGNFSTYGGGNSSGANNTFNSQPNTNSSTTGVTVATSINSTGSSGTGANLPPYLGINFIIKT